MKKITYLIASLLLMSMVFSMVGCSSETTDTSSDGNINVSEEVSNTPDPSEESDNAAPSNSTPENDTAAGLKVIKIDSTDTSLTEEQKAVVEYFDTDYLNLYNYEAMRRYPQIFDGSQVSVIGSVLKVVSMDAEQYQLVLWMDVGDLGMGAWLSEQYQGAYLLLTGNTAGKICDAVQSCPEYQGQPPISVYADLESTIEAAHSMAQPGDVVLLSPACASFDRYKNFAERGEAFKKYVYGLE